MDINAEVVNVYRCVRDQVEELVGLLQCHRDRHGSEYYYQVRSQLTSSALERAARFIYLNKTCFNGLYRENSKGQFNVPIGRYKNPSIYDVEVLRAASVALQTTQITVSSFESVLRYAKTSQDFVYFDPPYYPLSPTSNFTAYHRHCFNQDDQVRLQNTAVELANRGVNVMLSNSDCPFIRDLYQDFRIHTIHAARTINSKAGNRGKITEVLVTSY
jgi:DNA adenine methylase